MLELENQNLAQCMQNRELSWLQFNERVLEQANERVSPLLECLKFISIFTSNLDEFYMIRVGNLLDATVFAPKNRENKTQMTAKEQLIQVLKKTEPLYELRSKRFTHVTERLKEHGISYTKIRDLDANEKKKLAKHFIHSIMPFLTAQIIDHRHSFPHLANKELYVAVSLKRKSKLLYGIISVPASLDRMVVLEEAPFRYVLLEEVICYFSDYVFELYTVLERTILSVTRNADLNMEEFLLDEDVDYRQQMKKILKKRLHLSPVRLEVQYHVEDAFTQYFCEKLDIAEDQVFLANMPLDLKFCFSLEDRLDRARIKPLLWREATPCEGALSHKKANVMKAVQKKDILLSYPYDSITPLLNLIRQAAEDGSVQSIKITLYRLDRQSKLAEALIAAAENGKEVVVLMELRARFDESNNIEWANRLDEAGCRVIYGPVKYKVHSKICLITKKDFGKVTYITQLGTGNYNEKTAKQYTDLCLMTANQEVGADAAAFFSNLLLGEIGEDYRHLWVAPKGLKTNLFARIDREILKAQNGQVGQIILKCNSLTDKDIIEKLIEASCYGVRVSMIVRGICCMVPKVMGLTDHIQIISIVGRFLEHARIFCFGSGSEREVFLSSADLMTRNTERRIEIACPVYDETLRDRICDLLDIQLADNTKAWELQPNGSYVLRSANPDLAINAQELLQTYGEHVEEKRGITSRVLGKKNPFGTIFSAVKRFFLRETREMNGAGLHS